MIELQFHWLYIPFVLIVAVLLVALCYTLATDGGSYDFFTPLFGCGLLIALVAVVGVFGGILWW
jgi:hypothetical protein